MARYDVSGLDSNVFQARRVQLNSWRVDLLLDCSWRNRGHSRLLRGLSLKTLEQIGLRRSVQLENDLLHCILHRRIIAAHRIVLDLHIHQIIEIAEHLLVFVDLSNGTEVLTRIGVEELTTF